MAQRRVKDLSFTPSLCPDNRHHGALDPGMFGTVESGGREDFNGGIDVEVVLFRFHLEIVQAFRYRVV